MARIRSAQMQDAQGIATVHVRSWQTTYAGIMPDEFLQSLSIEKRTARWEQGLQNATKGEFNLVAERDGQIVGFASGGPERDGHPHYKGELYAIYLLQGYQGQGIGRALFLEVVRRLKARGFEKMLLWVARDNQPARFFYEHMGGVVVAEKSVELAGRPLVEVAYGYDLNGFA